MKKSISIIFVFILFLSGCDILNLNDGDITDPIKSTNIILYLATVQDGDTIKGDMMNSNYVLFDKQGNRTEVNVIGQNGELFSKTTYTYDKKGNLLKYSNYDANESLVLTETYEYDKKGNKTRYEVDGILTSTYSYEYDKNGNKIEENEYNANGILVWQFTYEYDEDENEIETNKYYSNGLLERKFTYEYSDNGSREEEYSSNSDGSLKLLTISEFDISGYLTEHWVYEYGETLKYRYTYLRNKFENMVESNRYNGDGSLDMNSSWSLKYDENNNWIVIIYSIDGELIHYTEREIEYY